MLFDISLEVMQNSAELTQIFPLFIYLFFYFRWEHTEIWLKKQINYACLKNVIPKVMLF